MWGYEVHVQLDVLSAFDWRAIPGRRIAAVEREAKHHICVVQGFARMLVLRFDMFHMPINWRK